MSDADRLRDLLEQAAPTQPDVDPATRAAAVARRGRSARTRDRALIGAAAVAVVAVAVVAPLTLGGDTPDGADPTPPSVQVEPCPGSPMDVQDLDAASSLGPVVAVRSCPVNGRGGDRLPNEPLTGEHAQAFADDVAALPAYELPSFCMVANVMQQPWALQVEQDGGELITIGSTMRVCGSVTVDGDQRGVGEVIAAFEGNLARQWQGTPELGCPTVDWLAEGAPTWNASFDPATATAGVVCYRVDPMGAQEYSRTEAELSPEQLATVVEDLAANIGPGEDAGGCIDTGPQRMIVLEDSDGDQAAFVDDDCVGEFAGARGTWKPGPEASDAIAAALGGLVN